MNKEDLKKNFIPLSKIAKEKKYAQEYLGLLARRGDLGSIRIGKRWYTKSEWFSEFVADAETRRAEAKESVKISEVNVENISVQKKFVSIQEMVRAEMKGEEEIRVVMPVFQPQRIMPVIEKKKVLVMSRPSFENSGMKVGSGQPSFGRLSQRGTDSLRIERKLPTIDLRKRVSASAELQRSENVFARSEIIKAEKINMEGSGEVEIEKRSEKIKIWNNPGAFSPSFVPREKEKMSLFPKFAFAFSFVLLFVLLFQVAFAYKNDLIKLVGLDRGIVAGASDEKKSNFEDIRSVAGNYLANTNDAVKENFSFSRLIVTVAKEKNSQ